MSACQTSRLGLLLGLLAILAPCTALAERLFGVVPQYSPSASVQRWQPLLDHLSRQTGGEIRFITAPSVTTFEERVLAGHYDYVFLNPLLFQQARHKIGYRALARDEQALSGVLVVRRDGPTSLAGLRGRVIAFPAPRALAATLLSRRDLQRAGIPHGVIYLGTHESVFRSVRQGEHVAGGGSRRTFELLPEAERAELRILHQTAPVVSHIFAVHPRVPHAEAERVQKALLALHRHAQGKTLLTGVGMKQVVFAREAEFASLEGLRFPQRPRRIDMHVVPRLEPDATRRALLPLATTLKQKLEIDVVLHVYPDMGEFDRALRTIRGPALINANPLQALRLIDGRYEVIAQQLPAQSPQGMRSMIFVRQDSPYRALADLRGKRIAFGGDRNAFFASVVPRLMLDRAGLAGQYVPVYPGEATSKAIQPLLDGRVEAAAAGSYLLETEEQARQIKGKLRVLAESEPFPGLAWLVGPDLDPELREEIRFHLLNYTVDVPGHEALRQAAAAHLRRADNRTFDVIRRYQPANAP